MRWCSSHLKRKIPSALSAETMIMPDSMAECNWLRCVSQDAMHDPVKRDWRSRASKDSMSVVIRGSSDTEKVHKT